MPLLNTPGSGNNKEGTTSTPVGRAPRPTRDLDVVSHSLDQTRRIGARLAALVEPGDLILLDGPFGAGKTSFTQGLARGLNVGADYITSPTFTLINEYNGRIPLYHADLYRLAGAEQAVELGLTDYIDGDGVTVIEWPERALEILPPEHLTVYLGHINDTKRSIRLHAEGEHYRALIERFKQTSFANTGSEY